MINYNDREKWILAQGTWLGIAASFSGIGILINPTKEPIGVLAFVLGVIFFGFALYCKSQLKTLDDKMSDASKKENNTMAGTPDKLHEAT